MTPFWIHVICITFFLRLANCEIFTAVDDIAGIEHLEASLLNGLKKYITGLRAQLDTLKTYRGSAVISRKNI